ncbi:MAG: SIR2 family NAD-dependent protein deacylase [Nitrospiraceae bacterium]
MSQDLTIQEVRARLVKARSVTVLTGAGISADSGVPTFRGKEGLWRNFRAEELATPAAFANNPRLVWEWYNWRRELIATKQPNPAHYALVEMERRYERFWLVTQNVDGLHVTAGSRKLSEIHGNIWTVRCTQCGTLEANRDLPIAILPSCAICRSVLRPHIVWFGESLAVEDLRNSDAALRTCDVLLIIGTSGIVYPAAGFAAVAKEAGAYVVEINLDSTPASSIADVIVLGRASEIVPRLL